MTLYCPCVDDCTCTYESPNPRGVMQNISDRAAILQRSVTVPRESKMLARKTVADRATDVEDCRRLLELLGLLDIDTLAEPS